ncbi:MAG: ABC transporter permease subunit [Candidatus Dormibacteria bacterium]
MTRIGAVALYTMLEMRRRRLLLVFAALAVLLSIGFGVIGVYAVQNGSGIPPGILLTQAVGLAGFFCWMAAIAIGMTTINHDLDRGAAIAILSKPVSRLEYLAGKLLASAAGLVMILGLVGLGLLLTVLLAGTTDLAIPLLEALAALAANLLLLLILILMFSVFLNNILAAILGVVITTLAGWIATVSALLDAAAASTAGGLPPAIDTTRSVVDVLYWVFPHPLKSALTASTLGANVQGGGNLSALATASGLADVVFWAAYCAVLLLVMHQALARRQV